MERPPDNVTTGNLLWRVATKWRAAVDRAVAPLGLTHAQYSLLASLYGLSRNGVKPSQRELADFTGLEPIYVSKIARALEQAGLLTRSEHPVDPRAVQLTPTDKGAEVALRAVTVVRGLQEELLAPVGGTGSRRARELAVTLNILLGTPPESGRADENGSSTMTPPLTSQDLAEAQGASKALLDSVLGTFGLSNAEYVVLRVLSLRGPFDSPAAFHEFLVGQPQLSLTRETAAAMLARMEERGLITGSAHDGTEPTQVTAEGATLHAEVAQAVAPVTARLFADFDPDDLAVAHRVLTQIVERAGHIRDELSGASTPGQ